MKSKEEEISERERREMKEAWKRSEKRRKRRNENDENDEKKKPIMTNQSANQRINDIINIMIISNEM